MRELGCAIALDDVGADHRSLALMPFVAPEVIKLDMRLVRDVHVDPYKAGITSQLLQMARKLGVETVAEGIESADELAWFVEHGADYVQGFHIARPQLPVGTTSP